MTPWSTELINKAWDFAALAHQGQTYATPNPDVRLDYINHVGAVTMELMWELARNPDATLDANLLLQCALLHDVLEDTPYTYAQLAAEFGKAVADGVLALSKQADLPRPAQMRDSLQRIQRQPREVWMVKLADRINNLSEPPAHWTAQRIAAYGQEGQLIHDELKSAHAGLAERLQAKIDAYQAYSKA